MSTIVTITPTTTSVLAFTPATPVMRPATIAGASMTPIVSPETDI